MSAYVGSSAGCRSTFVAGGRRLEGPPAHLIMNRARSPNSREWLADPARREVPRQARTHGADESVCKPGSVLGSVTGAPLCGHPSTTAVTDSLLRSTRGSGGPPSNAHAVPTRDAGPSWPCSGWGLPSRPSHLGRWWSLAPPFHPCPAPEGRVAVCSLLHFPAGHPGWALPTTLPCGARTFLDDPPRRSRRRGRPADSSAHPKVASRRAPSRRAHPHALRDGDEAIATGRSRRRCAPRWASWPTPRRSRPSRRRPALRAPRTPRTSQARPRRGRGRRGGSAGRVSEAEQRTIVERARVRARLTTPAGLAQLCRARRGRRGP